MDGKLNKTWRSSGSDPQSLLINLQSICEFGGLKIVWDEINFPIEYDLFISNDGLSWENIYSCVNNGGGKSYVNLKDSESRYIKINISKSSSGISFGINELRLLPVEYSESINRFFINIAKDFPRGYYPRYFNEEKSYWNVIGVEDDRKEALINEDGMIEIDKNSFFGTVFVY